MGLLRPGNLTFGKDTFGYRHMFMALRCNDDGLAKCGLDALYSSTNEKDFPPFNGDLNDGNLKVYLGRVMKNAFNAP